MVFAIFVQWKIGKQVFMHQIDSLINSEAIDINFLPFLTDDSRISEDLAALFANARRQQLLLLRADTHVATLAI